MRKVAREEEGEAEDTDRWMREEEEASAESKENKKKGKGRGRGGRGGRKGRGRGRGESETKGDMPTEENPPKNELAASSKGGDVPKVPKRRRSKGVLKEPESEINTTHDGDKIRPEKKKTYVCPENKKSLARPATVTSPFIEKTKAHREQQKKEQREIDELTPKPIPKERKKKVARCLEGELDAAANKGGPEGDEAITKPTTKRTSKQPTMSPASKKLKQEEKKEKELDP